MSKFKPGDKIVLEINNVLDMCLTENYKFLDEKGIEYDFCAANIDNCAELLSEYSENNKAWKLAQKILAGKDDNGYNSNELLEIFGTINIHNVFKNNTYTEVVEKITKWENSKIQIGDIVCCNESYGLVLSENQICFRVIMGNGIQTEWYKERCTKTKKHIDLSKILNQINGDEND